MALSQSLEHIHGAAFIASEAAIVAGTHDGVWQVSTSAVVSEVGHASDDFMGFTVAEPNRWFASGHPGPGSSAPNPLGLIASTDAGQSWTSVSLSGESDFHALAANADTIAGFDATGLRISVDGGVTWKNGQQIRPSSLAFAGPKLLAATQKGLMVSTDSGSAFQPIAGAPAAVMLSAVGSAVWCVDGSGSAWSSADAGATWTQRQQVGQIGAIAAVDANTAYALTTTELIAIR